MAIPADCTQITPVQIQTNTTTTENGVSTTITVLGDDDNLYLTIYQIPNLNPNQVTLQPWIRIPPIIVLTALADYPFPIPATGNVINSPYKDFKIQGQ